VIRWLVDEGRFAPDVDTLIAQLGRNLCDAGAPLWRLRLSMRTLHPLITAVSTVWERELTAARRIESVHGFDAGGKHAGNPLQIIGETRRPFRRRLDDGLGADDHQVLYELRDRGATDYFGLRIQLSNDRFAIVVFVGDSAEGFTDDDLAGFHEIARFLAPVVDVFRLDLLSHAVTEAYLGKRTAQRVLDGQIIRGDVEQIRAAVLVSDIRGWTALNARVSPETAVGMANRFFEILATAIDRQDGEILKFLGDGLLAIFPAGEELEAGRAACSRALAAAESAVREAGAADPSLDLRFGIGLNYGEVLYGNIGAADRINFTVMGQAVNLAARVEGLTGRLQHRILFTEDVAQQVPQKAVLVGRETLKGQTGATPVYTVAGD